MDYSKSNKTYWIETGTSFESRLALSLLPFSQYYIVTQDKNIGKDIELFNHQPIFVGSGADEILSHDYLTKFMEFVSDKNPVMISFRIMKDLIEAYQNSPDFIGKLVSNIEWYINAGNNFKYFKEDEKISFQNLAKHFRKVVIYNSYHAMECAFATHETFPKIYSFLKKSQPHYIKKYFNNNHKIYLSEPCLVAIIFNQIIPLPIVDLELNKHIKFKFSTESRNNTYSYDKIRIKDIEKYILKLMKKNYT